MRHIGSSFLHIQISCYSVNDCSGTVGSVRAKGTSTLRGLRKLVGLVKIPEVIRIIHAVMEAAASQGIPGINAERTTVSSAAGEDFCLASLIADRSPTRGCGAIAKSDTFDLNGQETCPCCGIVGIAGRISRHTECSSTGKNGFMADLPHKTVRCIKDKSPA